jgi:hypothetical protein
LNAKGTTHNVLGWSDLGHEEHEAGFSATLICDEIE